MNNPLAVYSEEYWRVHEVTPMFNFQYSKIILDLISLKIHQTLVSATLSPIMVKIKTLPYLKYSNEDPDGLMITVRNEFEPNDKVVYVAIFLSWGNCLKFQNETIHLPYMLEHGERNVGAVVQNTMKTMFYCAITPIIKFTLMQLLDFMFKFIENDTSHSSNKLLLSYEPSQAKNKVTLSFELGDIRCIWNRIKESNIDQDRRLSAYQVIQNRINQMYRLDVTLLHLCEVVLPNAEVKYSGMVKIKTPENINSVFTVLNEITGRF